MIVITCSSLSVRAHLVDRLRDFHACEVESNYLNCITMFSSNSLARSQHYSDGLMDIFTQYGDHLYRYDTI